MSAPLHDVEVEQSVLGAILMADRTLYKLAIEDGLKVEDFYRDQHRVIYAAMLELHDQGGSIDRVTLAAHLQATGHLDEAGGPAAIGALMGAVPMAANVRQYAARVRELADRRALAGLGQEITASAGERPESADELVQEFGDRMLDLRRLGGRRTLRPAVEVLDEQTTRLGELARQGRGRGGVPTGFVDLDRLLGGGLQPGNLVVLAARPAMGKSALAMNVAEHAARAGSVVAVFSLEMSEAELAVRLIASHSGLNTEQLATGHVTDWSKFGASVNDLAQAPLFFDDSSDLGLIDVRSKARRLHGQRGLGLVIVDYLQLMRPADHRVSRVEQVSQLSRGLKVLAGELAVPVLALSQLNRGVEQRLDKRPLLSDLRESGAIEQDADVVMFIYREEIYDRDTDRKGEAEVIVAKHRNGQTDAVELVFQAGYTRFMSKAASERYAA